MTAPAVGSVRLTPKASRLAARGQVWFFADDLESSAARHGDLVHVEDHRGQRKGIGFYSAASKVRLRVCGPPRDELEPRAYLRDRLLAAVARREAFPREQGRRLVHGEADGLPGLAADQYGDAVVVQVTSPVVENHLSSLVATLVEATGADAVVARNDTPIRELEGLPVEVRLLHGRRVETAEIVEHGVAHLVDLFRGHKTGFYLDQRRARRRVQELARGRRVLDLFAYQAAFSLAALAGGAASCVAVDTSADALARGEQGAARNRLDGLEFRAGNAFTIAREMRRAQDAFDLVVVDPPAFAKSRADVRGAERGYRDLNTQAMRLVAPGGWLLTCSCSYHVAPSMFERILRQAAAGLPFPLVTRERIMADGDHPVLLSLPQSEYLKAFLLERVG